MTSYATPSPLFLIPPVLSLLIGLGLAALAVLRGWRRKEARLFALVCVGMSLLNPAFVVHNLVADETSVLAADRLIHFFYVYVPFFFLLFFSRVLELRIRGLILTSLVLSTALSWFTHTDLYFNGLYHYRWGSIARGGPLFQFFGLYGFAVSAYCVFGLIRRLRTETNPRLILKFKYLLISFGLSILLTLFNIPAINGVDFYPLGNLTFIPLAVMAYGLLRHRLLDIRSMLHRSLAWLVVSSLVLLPNLAVFALFQWRLREWPAAALLAFFTVWLSLNLLYFIKVQPRINRAFHRHHTDLVRGRMAFLEEIAFLKNLEELSAALSRTLMHNLGLPRADVFIGQDIQSPGYRRVDGKLLDLDPALEKYLIRGNRIIEIDHLPIATMGQARRTALENLMDAHAAGYLMPMVQDRRLLAVILLPEKPSRLPLTNQEYVFIEHIRASGTVALFNSMLYQSVSDLRDRLEARKAILQREIHEREKAQRALADSERQYRLLAENVMDVIWIYDIVAKRFAYVSPSIERLLGYTAAEAHQLHPRQVLTPASHALARSILPSDSPVAQPPPAKDDWTSRFLNIELELIRKDGSTVWSEVSAGPMKEPGVACTTLLGVTRDITERRRRMALQQAKSAAEKANRAKSEFLANMSHELRTPLNHIIGFTELVVDQHFGPLNEIQSDHLGNVLSSSRHLLELINDILDLSKVEAGKMALAPTPVELRSLLENSLTIIKEKSLRHGIRLTLDTQQAPKVVQADQRKLKQVLYNLLSNAVKFTPDGGDVCLAVAPLPGANGDGPQLAFSVTDTGIGIDAADLERIFDTFEQVERSTARHYEGTGLGLSLSRRLVELHGGRIWAESAGRGQGSRFVFTLPFQGGGEAADKQT
jgi:PAS domain S-box-containing protein